MNEFSPYEKKDRSYTQVIKAENDSFAYAIAYEEFCRTEVDFAYNADLTDYIPKGFRLFDSDSIEVAPLPDTVLSQIKGRVYSSPQITDSRYTKKKPESSYPSSSYSSGGGNWQQRMETDEYKRSVAREEYLRQAGLKDAAKIERQRRLEYLKGNGYESKDGGTQVHYKGSAQQQRDLDAIDKYAREHPEF